MASTLGVANPLTYRGYVYDAETELYYLQSRYYNSEVGRFINADILVSTGQGFTGNNMFVYCGSNPISYIDKEGTLYTPGQIHNFVVDDICRKDSNKSRAKPKIKYIEVYFGHEYGFCDVYDKKTHEIWEVKRINGGITCTLDAANAQLRNYVLNGIMNSQKDWDLQIGGTETVIEGNCFTKRDKDGQGTYIIGYWDVSPYFPNSGIIYYDYIYIPDPKEAAVAVEALLGVGIGIYVYMQISSATNERLTLRPA